jgi:hypothetical protein
LSWLHEEGTCGGKGIAITDTLLDRNSYTHKPELPTNPLLPPNPSKMLANTSNPQSRRKAPALEAMLSSLEIAGDLLSGSECSSLATSPVHEDVSTFGSQPRGRQHERNEKSHLALRSLDPIDVVRNFLNHIDEPEAAKEFLAEDAKAECCSAMVRGESKKREDTQVAKGGLDGLLASCSGCHVQIDSIFACGDNVAAFGHLSYSDGPSSRPRDVRFSIWACVDAAREKIVELRWLDQVLRVEGDRMDRH